MAFIGAAILKKHWISSGPAKFKHQKFGFILVIQDGQVANWKTNSRKNPGYPQQRTENSFSIKKQRKSGMMLSATWEEIT